MMEAYKFETIIKKNGVIEIPEISKWAQQRVEVFVVINPTDVQETKPSLSVTAFLNRWRGFLKGYEKDFENTVVKVYNPESFLQSL